MYTEFLISFSFLQRKIKGWIKEQAHKFVERYFSSGEWMEATLHWMSFRDFVLRPNNSTPGTAASALSCFSGLFHPAPPCLGDPRFPWIYLS